MKTILIVDDDRPVRAEMVKCLARDKGQFRILEAENGRRAMEILEYEAIDLLVTDLDMPVMDGFELLALMLQQHASVPIIIMSSFGVGAIDDELEKMGAICYIEKPFDSATIAGQIRQALALLAKGQISGISTLGFLQLLHMEKKSCSLTIRAGEKSGRAFLSGGELIDAACDKKHGEEAMLEILTWDDCEIYISVPRHFRRVIHRPLQGLLLEATRLLDEGRRRQGRFDLIDPPRLGAHYDEDIDDKLNRIEMDETFQIGWDVLLPVLEGPLQVAGVTAVAAVDLRETAILAARFSTRHTELPKAVERDAALVREALRRDRRDPLRELLLTRDDTREMWVLLDPGRQIALYLVLDRHLSGVREVRREVGLMLPSLIAVLDDPDSPELPAGITEELSAVGL